MVSKKPLSKTEAMPCIKAKKQVTAAKKDLKRAESDYFKATKARSDAMNKYLAARKAQSLARRKGGWTASRYEPGKDRGRPRTDANAV